MKFKYKILSLTAAILVFGSCDREEFLNIPPYGQVVPEHIEDFELLLQSDKTTSGITTSMSDELYFPYTGNNTDFMDGNFVSYGGDTRVLDAIKYADGAFGLSTNGDTDYTDSYKNIIYANLVIEASNNANIEGSEAEKNRARAAGLVLRAHCYWVLVNTYAKQYDPATAETDLGVQLKLKSAQVDDGVPRSTVAQVYEQIYKDLTDAIELDALSKESATSPQIISQAAAYGTLARYHLYRGEYDEALEAADNALALKSTVDNIVGANINFTYYTGTEMIMYVVNSDNQSLFSNNAYMGNCIASHTTTDMYSKDNDGKMDFRLKTYFSGAVEYDGDFYYPYQSVIFYTYQGYHSCGVSVPEMLLIRAECNARQGTLANVNDDLNAIRINRIENYSNMPDFTDKNAALEFVKDERVRELHARGLRLFDLKRYNQYDNSNITLTRNYHGGSGTMPAKTDKWIAPYSTLYVNEYGIEQNNRVGNAI